MKWMFSLVLVAGLLTIGGVRSMAQHGTSTLEGLVLDANGKPVPNASITYQSGGGAAPHVIRTDGQGRFSVSKLRADIYDVRASSQGVYSDWKKNVNLRPGQITTLILRLTHAKDTDGTEPAGSGTSQKR
jgi:Carboxypeptidase regulatory-like domain